MSTLALACAGVALAAPAAVPPIPSAPSAALRPPPPHLDPERRQAYLDYALQRTFRRADSGFKTALIGGGIWLGSQAIGVYGSSSGNDGLLVVGGLGTLGGGVATFVGMGQQAGAVNRGARLLEYEGDTVDRANGRAAWWLFGGSFAPAFVASLATGGNVESTGLGVQVGVAVVQVAAMGGSIATGRLQHKRNLATYEVAGSAAHRRRAFAVRVVPTGSGAVVTAAF